MNVKTRLFGQLDIGDDKIIHFENGIIGYPTLKNFVVVHDVQKPNAAIMWLQSLDEGEFAMPVLTPNILLPDYAPSVPDASLDVLDDYDSGDLMLFVTMTVPEDLTKMTINLKAPIIINNKNRYACQAIAENEEYIVRYPIYDLLQQRKAGGK